MKIFVVIPAFNEEQYLQGCLEAFARQTRPVDGVIVVDNNSTDRTAQIAGRYPFVQVVAEPRQGISWARDRGFDVAHAAGADIICRTDADARPVDNWIEVIEAFFTDPTRRNTVAITGPINAYGSPFNYLLNVENALISVTTKWLLGGRLFLRGNNTAFRCRIWDELNSLLSNEDSVLHEDMDLSFFIADYGQVCVVPAMRMRVSARTFVKSPAKTTDYIRRWLGMRQYLRSTGALQHVAVRDKDR